MQTAEAAARACMDCEALVLENEGLVRAAARRFTQFEHRWDAEELLQAGRLGLLEAARRFDPSRGLAFSTLAVPYILGEMKGFLRGQQAVHVPRTIRANAATVARAAEQLQRRLGRAPTLLETADACGLTPEETALAMESRADARSLQEAASQDADSATLGDALPDRDSAKPYERIEIRSVLDGCGPQEKALLTMRYLRGMSQADTAKALGVSQGQVSKLEKKALLGLRKEIAQ